MLKKFFQILVEPMTKVARKLSPAGDSAPKVLNGQVKKKEESTPKMLAQSVRSSLESNVPENDEKFKQKKPNKAHRYAMLLAYQGKNYYGMQIQLGPEPRATVESQLFDAMVRCGVITDFLAKNPAEFQFQRAARTDKYVSAVRQICSMKLAIEEDFLKNGPEKLNEYLPKDIRVLGIRRTTPGFHSWKTCDARTYSYTLPTFALASSDQLTSTNYKITEERIKEVDDLLCAFIGTHNFYNYTSKREHSDQSCFRFIMSFKCEKPFIYHDLAKKEDIEFITICIKGQSFMLHQIRKMLGMTIAVLRNFMYKCDIARSFEEARMDIPRAPGLGLLLERLHYMSYDKRYCRTHAALSEWGEEVEMKIQKARQELIFENILAEECATNSMMQWLATLPMHNFATDPEDETNTSRSKIFEANSVANKALNGDMENSGSEAKTGIDATDDVEIDDRQGMEEFEEKQRARLSGQF